MHALFSCPRWVGLVLMGGLLVACSTPEPASQEGKSSASVPVVAPVVSQKAPDTEPGNTRDSQGRRIAAHFSAPAGTGGRVVNTDPAGTYRVMLETLKTGGWRVQDFYEATGNRFTAPYVIQQSADLTRQPVRSVDGWLRVYHHSGGRLLVQMFRDGKAEGTASRYYADGKRQSVVIYRDDQPEGVGTFWHANGKLALKVTFRQGKAALFRGWDDSGERLLPDVAKAWYERMTHQAS